jgi:hypothetical protein
MSNSKENKYTKPLTTIPGWKYFVHGNGCIWVDRRCPSAFCKQLRSILDGMEIVKVSSRSLFEYENCKECQVGDYSVKLSVNLDGDIIDDIFVKNAPALAASSSKNEKPAAAKPLEVSSSLKKEAFASPVPAVSEKKPADAKNPEGMKIPSDSSPILSKEHGGELPSPVSSSLQTEGIDGVSKSYLDKIKEPKTSNADRSMYRGTKPTQLVGQLKKLTRSQIEHARNKFQVLQYVRIGKVTKVSAAPGYEVEKFYLWNGEEYNEGYNKDLHGPFRISRNESSECKLWNCLGNIGNPDPDCDRKGKCKNICGTWCTGMRENFHADRSTKSIFNWFTGTAEYCTDSQLNIMAKDQENLLLFECFKQPHNGVPYIQTNYWANCGRETLNFVNFFINSVSHLGTDQMNQQIARKLLCHDNFHQTIGPCDLVREFGFPKGSDSLFAIAMMVAGFMPEGKFTRNGLLDIPPTFISDFLGETYKSSCFEKIEEFSSIIIPGNTTPVVVEKDTVEKKPTHPKGKGKHFQQNKNKRIKKAAEKAEAAEKANEKEEEGENVLKSHQNSESVPFSPSWASDSEGAIYNPDVKDE